MTFCSSSCSCKVLINANYVVAEVADIGVIGQQARTILIKIAHLLIGVFTLRTIAIYNNNWVVFSALTLLCVARITTSSVKIQLHVMPSDLSHKIMCSCQIFTRSLTRSHLLRSRNLGLAYLLVLKSSISTSH